MPRLLLLLALVIGACATDETLSSTEQAETKGELTSAGYTCIDDPLGSLCGKCWWATIEGQTTKVCAEWRCDLSGNCEWKRTYYPAATLDKDLNYWFEGEDATFIGPAGKVSDAGASTGFCMVLSGGYSSKTFEAGIEGTLTAWVRAIAPSTSASSFYLQLDSVSTRVELPVTTTWTWIPLYTSQYIGVGNHNLRLYTEESGVKIDRILLTANPDFTPIVQHQQAETASLIAPMQVGTIRTIPTTSYVYVPNGAGSGGLARLEVAVPYAGNYTVWGRASAPTSSDNSFRIGKYGQTSTTWNLAVTSGWAWNHAPGTYAFDDYEILDVRRQEDGAKLDKLLYTNDPGFVPVESSGPIVGPS